MRSRLETLPGMSPPPPGSLALSLGTATEFVRVAKPLVTPPEADISPMPARLPPTPLPAPLPPPAAAVAAPAVPAAPTPRVVAPAQAAPASPLPSPPGLRPREAPGQSLSPVSASLPLGSDLARTSLPPPPARSRGMMIAAVGVALGGLLVGTGYLVGEHTAGSPTATEPPQAPGPGPAQEQAAAAARP
ncbi:MAG TPA: hypothetical protein VKU41_10655, partial [Polyangiaceae bacterium]|nr:hypothetical protein [Polyangiaceae bacterium]